MEIVKLLKQNYELAQLFDLGEYSKEQITFIRALIKSAYNEGFDDGKATVMNDLDEFLRIKKDN
jgi:hypothetical protein